MGATTELEAEIPDANNPNAVCVLFPKERLSPQRFCFFEVFLECSNLAVGADLFVDHSFDRFELRSVDRTEMGKVESKSLGRDERTHLVDVGTENPAQGFVQQVR